MKAVWGGTGYDSGADHWCNITLAENGRTRPTDDIA
jgi:hypothetical protein